MANEFCPECHSVLSASSLEEGRCESCGTRLRLDGEQLKVIEKKSPPKTSLKIDEDDDIDDSYEQYQDLLRQSRKSSSTFLFVLAAIFMLCSGAAVVLLGNQEGHDPVEIVVSLVFLGLIASVFVGLGFWAMYSPLIPTYIGLFVYVGITILDLALAPETAAKGIIIKIVMIVGFVKCIQLAQKAAKLGSRFASTKAEYDDEEPPARK